MANAAFSQLALEDGRGGAGISSKIGDMTDTMIRYAKRIASLETQIGFVTDIEQQVALFSEETQGIRPLPDTWAEPWLRTITKSYRPLSAKMAQCHFLIFQSVLCAVQHK